MVELNGNQIEVVSGGLSEKQEDSILGKIGAYSANSALLVSLFAFGYLPLQGLVVGGLLAPTIKIAGTYLMYENKDWIKDQMGEYYPL